MLDAVIKKYNLPSETLIQNITTGLINNTYLAITGDKEYIIQRINANVFKQPQDIDTNIQLIEKFLKKSNPNYFIPVPVQAADGKTMVIINNDFFRIFNFVPNTTSYAVAVSPQLAYEAAQQFGNFTAQLSAFPADTLKITLPHFHDLTLRYSQFITATVHANKERLLQSFALINQLKELNGIVDTYQKIKMDNEFKIRVTHHDTKISNVLFDEDQKGVCVIDLDTVMPGYFISDIGDMLRTYLPPVSEEEQDLSKVFIREDYFHAIVKGYMHYMKPHLTEKELHSFVYAGKFMIYMQALRFITDYLNNDIYYGATYNNHNLHRAMNQFTLLKDLLRLEQKLTDFIRRNFLS